MQEVSFPKQQKQISLIKITCANISDGVICVLKFSIGISL